MRMLTFANRTFKEIIRDPLTVAFGLGFPLVVLLLLTAIQANVPVALFELDKLTPGICVFGLSFVSLFSAMLISKDRETSLQRRLFTTPLTAADFLLGYSLPMLPISVLQSVICYVAALILGLKPTVGILWALLFLLPAAQIARNTVIATPVENIDLYYADPGDSEFAKLGLQYAVQGETNLIGFHAQGNYSTAVGESYAIMGMALWAEYLDGIAVVTVNAGG